MVTTCILGDITPLLRPMTLLEGGSVVDSSGVVAGGWGTAKCKPVTVM